MLSIRVGLVHIVACAALLMVVHTLCPPTERGFHCDDTSIQHPFKPIFFKTSWLFFFTLLLPTFLIIWCEDAAHQRSQSVRFVFGLFLNLFITEIVKRWAGRLRPHTFDFCNLARYCPNTTTSLYIPEFDCDNPATLYIVNTHLSFYSGHSSLGSYAGTYLVLYMLQSRSFHARCRAKALRALIYVLTCVFYLVPGYSQHIIKWHFLSDVLTGWLVGILLTLFTLSCINRRCASN